MNKLEVTERLLRFVGWQWFRCGLVENKDTVFEMGRPTCRLDANAAWFKSKTPHESKLKDGMLFCPDLFDADSAEGALWRERVRIKLLQQPRVLAIRDWTASSLMGCEIQDVDSDPYENPSSISDETGTTYEEAFCFAAYVAVCALEPEAVAAEK